MGLPMERTRVKPSQISQPRDQLIRPLSDPSHCQHINTFRAHCPDPPAVGFSPSNSQFCPGQLRRKFLTDNLPQIDLSESIHRPASQTGRGCIRPLLLLLYFGNVGSIMGKYQRCVEKCMCDSLTSCKVQDEMNTVIANT